jgi:DNA gyrase subunit A
MEIGLVRSIDIDREMQQAYLDYAMSVIVARALPDVRDGLKPVHRRILYAMYDMGMTPDSAYKKSARIVGEVLGKYHPHGDAAVYETMARMAQDFSMRYLLVDGQGNFGSVDGDPPAAQRYTEARLAAPAMNLLADIQKNTVDYTDNFDGTLKEPVVLPAALPNLLVNGATGIAVGMSTSIPPHNLGEVVDALVYMLANWEKLDDISIEDLMAFIQGPDFPTGGVIIQGAEEEGLTSAYGSGRGKVVVQARAHAEEMTRGRNRIIVTELPYMTNKSSLVERIAELVREGRLEGVADLRDESDRQGLRIVIELTKTAEPEKVLHELYKNTPMRSTFGIIMLALVDGEPRLFSLKQALRVYLEHRLIVIRRRSEYDLERARQRAHILEGLRIALKNLDVVIDLIRKAPDVETARNRLMKRFRLSEIQSQAILDMPLRRLAALERKKIEDEYREILTQIKELEGLLRSPKKMRDVVATELRQVKEAYGDRRRTQIAYLGKEPRTEKRLLVTDLTPERTVWIAATRDGMIYRTLDDNPPRSSGRDTPQWLLRVNVRDTIYLVSDQGEAAGAPVHAIPEADHPADGAPFYKVSALREQDRLAALFTLPPRDERAEGWYVLTATHQGMVKKTPLSELPGPTAKTFVLTKVNEGDHLGWVKLTNGKTHILLATMNGMAIRFSEDDIRPMGLVAAGVGGIKLGKNDEVTGMVLAPSRGEILFIASDGKAKRVATSQFPVQGRFGRGVLAWKLTRTSRLVGVATGKETTHLAVHLDKLAPKAFRMDEVAAQTRSARGRTLVALKVGDEVISLTAPWNVPRPLSGEATKPEEIPSDGRLKEDGREPKPRTKVPARKPTEKKARPKQGKIKAGIAKPASSKPKAIATQLPLALIPSPVQPKPMAKSPATRGGGKVAPVGERVTRGRHSPASTTPDQKAGAVKSKTPQVKPKKPTVTVKTKSVSAKARSTKNKPASTRVKPTQGKKATPTSRKKTHAPVEKKSTPARGRSRVSKASSATKAKQSRAKVTTSITATKATPARAKTHREEKPTGQKSA